MQQTDEPTSEHRPVPAAESADAEHESVSLNELTLASAPKDGVSIASDASFKSPELGGRDGPEPTRFGDWERAGRCIDF